MTPGAFMDRSEPTELIICARVDGPPLRFKGRLLVRHARMLRHGSELFAELWQRNAGGCTLAFSAWHRGAWQADAVKVRTLDEAVSTLESVCAAQRAATPPDLVALGGDMADQLRRCARYAEEAEAFQHLMGRVLADWTALPNAA